MVAKWLRQIGMYYDVNIIGLGAKDLVFIDPMSTGTQYTIIIMLCL
jgi:hypothetical protein